MKFTKSNISGVLILSAIIALQACKAKKLAQKPAPPVETTQQAPPVVQQQEPPKQETAPVTPPAPAPKPDYNFSNIQFEFNASVLRTDAYPILDKAAAEMKKDPAARFNLKGYASIEGTEEHNMLLSKDRANSVKTYLINSGVSADQ